VTSLVLVTRAEGSWPELAARFSKTSIRLQFTATTAQVDPLDGRPGDEALHDLDRFSWLVVTSGPGARALSRRLASLPAGLRVAAVGRATAEALASCGFPSRVVAEEESASGLADCLAPLVAAGSRVLVVRPEGPHSDLAARLRSAGALVTEAPLYRTVASTHAVALADDAMASRFAGVAFTAPSTLRLWQQAAGDRGDELMAALRGVRRVAIGRTTAAYLADAGLPADATADSPSEAAVGDAIARALAPSTC
jgi:uroporphyrinogen-III synthase